MEVNLERELKQLKKRKLKAQEKGDLAEEAKLCNAVGEILFHYGYYEKAVKEHTKEVQLSEASQDTIGAAIAHRKVGECLCELKKFKEALFHQNLHLELARSAKNLVEEQRALATIGRTWLVHSDDAINSDEVEGFLLEAQTAFLKSLDVCDKLHRSVSQKELLEMKSRLYLNLGLIYENQKDLSRAKSFVEKALIIARDRGLRDTEYRCLLTIAEALCSDIYRDRGLRDTEYRCLLTIGGIRMKSDEDAHALRCLEQALQVARQGNNKFDEADALALLGKVFLKLGEFSAARSNLKKAYIINKTKRSDDIEELKSSLATAIKGIRFERKWAKLSEFSLDEQIKILDTLGDLYCQAKSFHKALGFYKRELDLAKCAGKSQTDLSPIYVSLAITYHDLKCPQDAIDCYMKELETLEAGNAKKKSDTWCNIAYVHDKSGHDYEQIEDAYMKALAYAEQAGKPQVVLRVWKCLADTQKMFDLKEKYQKSVAKVTELERQFDIEVASDDSDDERDSNNIDEDLTEVLIENELLLSESDEDDDNEGEDPRARNSSKKARIRSQRKYVNEKGETPLHEAAIAGNSQRVKELLEEGTDVHARDYCGWLPLHEACNHGHLEVAKLLLVAGSNVNDQSGEHCCGVTPLHDAAENGHVHVVKLLLSHGASINLKDDKGRTALEATIQTLKIDKADDELSTGRQQVVKLLRNYKETKNSSELRRRNVVFDEDEEAEESSEESTSTLQRFNDKLKKKEIERLQRMNKNILDNSKQGYVDEPHHQKKHSKGAVLSADDDSNSPGKPVDSSVQQLVGSANDVFSCETDEAPFEPFYNFGVEIGEDDSTYSSMDDLDDQSSDFESNSSIPDPVAGTSHDISSSLTGPVASHVSQKAAEWLVDDVGPRRVKRKRQAKLTNLARSTERTKQTSGPRQRLSLSNTHTGPRPKQSKLVVSQEPRAPASANSAMSSNHNYTTNCWSPNDPATSLSTRLEVTSPDVRTSIYDLPATSSRHTVAPGGTPPMRLRVWVQDKMFLIPCPQGNAQEAKCVGWLAEQASLRYFSSSGLRPKLALKTKEGAFLSVEDKVTDVLSSNEEVIASVESWDLPPLSERYRDACLNTNTVLQVDVLHILEADPHLSSLHLANKALQDIFVLPLFRALQCHDTLTKLSLPGNRIGDSGIQHLVSALPTLPSLAILDLTSNGITYKGLSLVAGALTSKDSLSSGTQQNCILQKLEELSFSYNLLGDSAGSSLAVILKGCPILTYLRIESCGLTHEVVSQGKALASAFKGLVDCTRSSLNGSKLLHLSVAFNSLGPQGITDLMTVLPPESLSHLNITSSLQDKGNQLAFHSIERFMEIGCILSHLVLGDCSIDDKDLELLLKARHMFSILSLDLSCNKIGTNGLPLLERLVKESCKLSTLILAGNEEIFTDRDGLQRLLVATKDSKTLRKLNLSTCGVQSPLEESFFDALKTSISQRDRESCLTELDLSYNLISSVDKERLSEEWHLGYSGESLTCLKNNLCLLTKL